MNAASDRKLLEAAAGGDEGAFRHLVEPHRGELHAHCYRMLGSLQDAEDALQDAMLRAWRGLARFEGRSSLRSWLYTIATNACLNLIARRPKRVLPVDYGPAADPHDGPGEPLVESVLVEPYPDERRGLEEGFAAPEARYELRESVELPFVAALQHLPASQRAVLERGDVDAVVAMLAEDATVTMPPMPTWYRGRDAIVVFLAEWAFAKRWSRDRGRFESAERRVRLLTARASGQVALAAYNLDPERGSYLPYALQVLSLRGARIGEIAGFVTPEIFPRFGLPAELPA